MDPLLLALAFLFGFGARQIGQPPLVGFLLAGFAANAIGVEGGRMLDSIAELGVTLLLFLIGLELDPKRLLKTEIWATATGHAATITILFGGGALAAAGAGIGAFAGLTWEGALALGFALSFSSTVFAVKNLDDRGEHSALHGRTAIGILILQDVFAVVFLTFAGGKLPEIWAIALVAVLALRTPLLAMMARIGHGELFLLFGLFLALGMGAGVFEMAGLKPDLGALVLGAVLAGHPRARELAHAMFPLKDLLLIGFFLQIGLAGIPTWEQLAVAAILVALVPVKSVLFALAFAQLRFRARSSILGALALGSYSEFGLIVSAIAANAGWIAPHWPAIIAIAVAGSFILAAPFQNAAHRLNPHHHRWMARFERRRRHPEEQPIQFGDARIAVLGMGRIGTGAYDDLVRHCGNVVVGVELDAAKVAAGREQGRRVIQADVTDPAFWHRLERGRVELVLLAMPAHDSNMFAYQLLRASQYEGKVAAIARFPDEAEALEEAGVDIAFNMYAEAGAGFASHVRHNLEDMIPSVSLTS
jgi:predicted Kef-type K+ transport protein